MTSWCSTSFAFITGNLTSLSHYSKSSSGIIFESLFINFVCFSRKCMLFIITSSTDMRSEEWSEQTRIWIVFDWIRMWCIIISDRPPCINMLCIARRNVQLHYSALCNDSTLICCVLQDAGGLVRNHPWFGSREHSTEPTLIMHCNAYKHLVQFSVVRRGEWILWKYW